jgi:glycosyltransferase involved in cell wall biosynthesis
MQCIAAYGEIVVIDNNSIDCTREIASQYTSEIHIYRNPGFIENHETMSFALSKVKTEWVYLTYVDELIPNQLLNKIVKISQENTYSIVEIYRKNFMYGREVFNYDVHPTLRMFKPKSVDFKNNIIHNLGRYQVPKSQVYRFKKTDDYSIWHFSEYNTSRLELVHNKYADLEASQRSSLVRQKFSGIRLLWKPIFYFFGTYIGLRGFRGGWPGFFISVQIAYFKFSIEARLWDIENSCDIQSIIEKYNSLKETILSESSLNN